MSHPFDKQVQARLQASFNSVDATDHHMQPASSSAAPKSGTAPPLSWISQRNKTTAASATNRTFNFASSGGGTSRLGDSVHITDADLHTAGAAPSFRARDESTLPLSSATAAAPSPTTFYNPHTSLYTKQYDIEHVATDIRDPNGQPYEPYVLNNTDKAQLFGGTLPSSIIIYGLPGSGKTQNMIETLMLLRPQIDLALVYTRTGSTVEKLKHHMPRRWIFTNLVARADDIRRAAAEGKTGGPNGVVHFQKSLEALLEMQAKVHAAGKCLRTFCALDDVLLDAPFKAASLTSAQTILKTGHRMGMSTWISAHKKSDIHGGADELSNRHIFLGDGESIGKDKAVLDDILGLVKRVPELDSEEKIRRILLPKIKPGSALVIQTGSGPWPIKEKCGVSVTIWKYPFETERKPFLVGNPDLYMLMYMYQEPMYDVTITDGGQMTSVPILPKSSTSAKDIVFVDPFAPKDPSKSGVNDLTTFTLPTKKGPAVTVSYRDNVK